MKKAYFSSSDSLQAFIHYHTMNPLNFERKKLQTNIYQGWENERLSVAATFQYIIINVLCYII